MIQTCFSATSWFGRHAITAIIERHFAMENGKQTLDRFSHMDRAWRRSRPAMGAIVTPCAPGVKKSLANFYPGRIFLGLSSARIHVSRRTRAGSRTAPNARARRRVGGRDRPRETRRLAQKGNTNSKVNTTGIRVFMAIFSQSSLAPGRSAK